MREGSTLLSTILHDIERSELPPFGACPHLSQLWFHTLPYSSSSSSFLCISLNGRQKGRTDILAARPRPRRRCDVGLVHFLIWSHSLGMEKEEGEGSVSQSGGTKQPPAGVSKPSCCGHAMKGRLWNLANNLGDFCVFGIDCVHLSSWNWQNPLKDHHQTCQHLLQPQQRGRVGWPHPASSFLNSYYSWLLLQWHL